MQVYLDDSLITTLTTSTTTVYNDEIIRTAYNSSNHYWYVYLCGNADVNGIPHAKDYNFLTMYGGTSGTSAEYNIETYVRQDLYILQNGVFNYGYSFTKVGASGSITAYSGYQYILDNSGNGTTGYVPNIEWSGYKYLKIRARFNSGTGVGYCSNQYPMETRTQLTTTTTTYVFNTIKNLQPAIGGWNGSVAIEIYDIYLTDVQ